MVFWREIYFKNVGRLREVLAKMDSMECFGANTFITGLLLKKSYDAYLAGSKMESVFYETKALTVGFMTSNYTSNGNLRVVNDGKSKWSKWETLQNVHSASFTESLKEVSIIKQEK